MENENKEIKPTKKKKSFVEFLKRIKWKRVIIVLVTLVVLVTGGVGGYFVYSVYEETDAFDAKKLTSDEPTRVFGINGTLVHTVGRDADGNRENITYDELPQVLVDAVVATEDSRYFEHNGFDLPRIVKAAIGNVIAGDITSGGSTITQQLIKKSYFPEEEQTYTRKFSEIFLAMEADKEMSKEEVLTLYLNKIYFGRGTSAIGVAAASDYYFSKDVSLLTLPEAALLAGVLNSPDYYDPFYNLEAATERRDTVLDLMLYHGYITQEEHDDAKKVKIENTLVNKNSDDKIKYDSYIQLVLDEAERKTGQNPREVSMEIYTYLDPAMQDYLDDYVDNFDYDTLGGLHPDLQVGVSIQSVKDGRIIGIIGGRNTDDTNFGLNRATIQQQPGSSLKPVTAYGMAFEFAGWSTGHAAKDKPYTKDPNWNPSNHDTSITGKNHDIPYALLQSYNLPAIWAYDAVLEKLGNGDAVEEKLEQMGVDMSKQGNTTDNISFSIGGWELGTSPIEMASIYATVSNGGVNIESHTIDHINLTATGEVINVDADIQAAQQQSISKETAFMIQEVMRQQIELGYGYAPYGHDQIRAKTGTSNFEDTSLFPGEPKDSWMIAYNPDISVATWMGYDKQDHITNLSAARLFTQPLMDYLTRDGVKSSYPPQPEGVYSAQVVKGSDPIRKASATSTNTMTAWFTTNGEKIGENAKEHTINALGSFSATLTADNRISVSFSAYDPVSATTDTDATDATKELGVVQYCVEVRNASGEVVFSGRYSSPSVTLDYIPTEDVEVSGFYAYENSSTIRSPAKTVSIKVGNSNNETPQEEPDPEPPGAPSASAAFVNSASLSENNGVVEFTVTAQRRTPGSTLIMTPTQGQSTELTGSNSSATFSASSTGTVTISVVEVVNGVSSAPTTVTVEILE